MNCGLGMLSGSCEMGSAIVLKSDKLEPRSIGSTSIEVPSPKSAPMADGGRDWSTAMGCATDTLVVVVVMVTVAAVLHGWVLLSKELPKVRADGEVMSNKSGDIGAVWASMAVGEIGGELPVVIGSSLTIFILVKGARDVIPGEA